MVIFLKSELAKHQKEISTLKKNDYYSLVKSLERENIILANQKKELSIELMKLKTTFEEGMNTHREEIQLHESQQIEHKSAIEYLEKSNNELQLNNRKLTTAIEEAKNELTTSKIQWSITKEEEYKKTIENFTHTIHDFIEYHNQQLSTIHEALAENVHETIDTKHCLFEEIKRITNQIDSLTNEIDDFKVQNLKKFSSPLNDNDADLSDMFSYLDKHIQKVSTQSLYFEAELNKKLHLLDELEHKMIQLANEIDNQTL